MKNCKLALGKKKSKWNEYQGEGKIASMISVAKSNGNFFFSEKKGELLAILYINLPPFQILFMLLYQHVRDHVNV